jgi:recombination protein RecT
MNVQKDFETHVQNAPTRSTNVIAEAFNAVEDSFIKAAPPNIDFVKESKFAKQVLDNNQFLRTAALKAPKSLQHAIINVASIGLSLNPAEKHAYLIPRSVNVGQGAWETRVFLEPSYMGLLQLAYDAKVIQWAQARCVYENDTILDNGLSAEPTHNYSPFATKEQRGKFAGAYCTAKTAGGDFLTTFMNQEEIDGIMQRSESVKRGKNSPWFTDFEEMAKKTVIKRAFKTWPRAGMERLAQAVEISNENSDIEFQATAPMIQGYNAEQKKHLDYLIANSDSIGMQVFYRSFFDNDLDAVWIALYHSFEKGSKGKYQKIIDQLAASGLSKIQEYADELGELLQTDQDAEAWELICDLDDAALNLIELQVTPEQKEIFAQIKAQKEGE